MRKLTIEALKCYETEDWGDDECRLDVFVDGVRQPPLKRDMDDGDKWTLNIPYTFHNGVKVELWDRDSPDDDDLLGSVTIGVNIISRATASFKGDGANYKLWYSVVDVPGSGVDLVQRAITKFEQSTKPGVWRYVSKNILLADIKQTIANPFNVAQGTTTQFCGPASIVFEFVSRHPHRYVEIC